MLTAEVLDRPPRRHNQSIKFIHIDKISIMAHIAGDTESHSSQSAQLFLTAGDLLKFDLLCLLLSSSSTQLSLRLFYLPSRSHR